MTPEDFGLKLIKAPTLFAEWRRGTMQRLVFVAEKEIKKVTPVVSGNLRRTVAGRVIGTGELGVVGPNTSYARKINNKWRYMERGWENAQGEINEIIERRGGEFWGSIVDA
jgi:hypothetical protein